MALPEQRHPGTPSRWDPLREFEDVYDRMGRLFRDFFGDAGPIGRPLSRFNLPLDLEETDAAYIAELDLPGVKKDDVTVEIVGNEICVRGEVKEHERTGVLRRQSRRVGSIEHRFTVPDKVDAERVEAELSDGVLVIRAPKSEPVKPKRIDVKVR
jgi:HSP20 family protein